MWGSYIPQIAITTAFHWSKWNLLWMVDFPCQTSDFSIHLSPVGWETANLTKFEFLGLSYSHHEVKFGEQEWTCGMLFVPNFSLIWWRLYVCMYVSFGQGSSLLWTHTLRPFYSRPIALTQEGRSLVNDVCVTEGWGGVSRHEHLVRYL